jgi:hypothetical protein
MQKPTQERDLHKTAMTSTPALFTTRAYGQFKNGSEIISRFRQRNLSTSSQLETMISI